MSSSDNLGRSVRLASYAFMLLVGVLMAWLHVATPMLVALFGMFALTKLHAVGQHRKGLTVALFLMIMIAIVYGLAFFARESVENLPKIAEKALPPVIEWAKQREIELPFTDYDSLAGLVLDTAKRQAQFLGLILKGVSMQLVFFIVGCVVAISLFLNPRTELDRPVDATPENLYALFCDEVAARFAALFASFREVMGAQLAISAINTVLTVVFVLATGMPHPVIITGATFLCGLVPVVGNLVSNTVIVAVGITVSTKMAMGALTFLVVIHKLEYFLNSRIIGARIRNPLWLMLLGLIVGEKIMGIAGMIIAPVILYYVKSEMSKFRLPAAEGSGSTPPSTPSPQVRP